MTDPVSEKADAPPVWKSVKSEGVANVHKHMHRNTAEETHHAFSHHVPEMRNVIQFLSKLGEWCLEQLSEDPEHKPVDVGCDGATQNLPEARLAASLPLWIHQAQSAITSEWKESWNLLFKAEMLQVLHPSLAHYPPEHVEPTPPPLFRSFTFIF